MPFSLPKFLNYKAGGSVYSRVETLMNPDKGLIGLTWRMLREAWFSEFADRLILVDYERLAQDRSRPAGGYPRRSRWKTGVTGLWFFQWEMVTRMSPAPGHWLVIRVQESCRT